MKVSKRQASDNRDAIIHAAAAQLRAHGFEQMSVTAIAQAAGLTHGALYSHFKSKETLKTEATKRAFEECLSAFSGLAPMEFLDQYLSPAHRDHPEQGCPTSALVSEARWQPDDAKAAFRDGVEQFIALTGKGLETLKAEHGRDRAVFMFASMVGGLAISRAIRDDDAAGSDDILRAVAEQLKLLIAASSAPARKTA